MDKNILHLLLIKIVKMVIIVIIKIMVIIILMGLKERVKKLKLLCSVMEILKRKVSINQNLVTFQTTILANNAM
jgi:hypothetical protein